MVWYVLSKTVSPNGRSFHSMQATSQALQPMQVVVSMSLQTVYSRWVPSPGTRWNYWNLILFNEHVPVIPPRSRRGHPARIQRLKPDPLQRTRSRRRPLVDEADTHE